MRTNIRLDKPFQLTGKWSLPNSDLHCQGTLIYDNDKLELNMLGGFSRSVESELNAQNDFERYPLVYCQSNELGKCTITKGIVTRKRTHHPHGETTEMSISSTNLFTGEFLLDHENQLFDGMTVSFTHLNEFVGIKGFQIDWLEEDGEQTGTTVNCKLPKKLELRVDAIDSNIAFEQEVDVSGGFNKLSMEIDTRVSFRPDHPKNLDWFMSKIWRFNYLLTLLTDEQTLPVSIQYSIPDGDERPNGWLVYKNSAVNTPIKPSPHLLFYFGNLGQRIETILEKWFSASETMADAMHLFMNAKRDLGDHKSKLLLLAHGLEAFSRDKGNAIYMDATEYKSVINTMNSAIPDNVVHGHLSSLKNRIKFGNEYSLRKRLRGLLDELSAETHALICKSTKNFINGIVETRNYHSHYSNDLREKALQGTELAWACSKLQMMFRILLLKNIGIDEKCIRNGISNHYLLGLQHFHWKDVAEVTPI